MILGVIGFGTVGRGLCDHFEDRGLKFQIYLRDPSKYRAYVHGELIILDPLKVVENCELIFEATCGSEGTPWLVAEAVLKSGKTLITSNKQLVCDRYSEIVKLQNENPKSRIFIEACVCGGVPLYKTLLTTISETRLKGLEGIMNGSTNYFLCRAFEDYLQLQSIQENSTNTHSSRELMIPKILDEMKDLGFLEADPTVDLDGFDAAHKLRILASMLLGWDCKNSITITGVRGLIYEDFDFMKNHLGCSAVRLIASLYRDAEGNWCAEVAPRFLKENDDSLFSRNLGGQNTILVHTEELGELVFRGPGAGQLPTVSAMLSDFTFAKFNIDSSSSLNPGKLRAAENGAAAQSSGRGVDCGLKRKRVYRQIDDEKKIQYRVIENEDESVGGMVFVGNFLS